MKNALIIGGTGLTGKKLTKYLLADKRYGSVKLLVRKPLDISYEKLDQVTFNFDNPDASKVMADEVYCCLGTTIGEAGSKKAFYQVDYEYVLMIATIAFKNGCKKFALISSMGANKKSLIFYSKTKGQILPEKFRPIHSKSVAFAMQFVMNGNYSGFTIFESDEIAAIANNPH